MNWNKYPFLRLVMALAVGIALYDAFGFCGFKNTWLYAMLILLMGAMVLLSHLLKSYRYRWTFGVLTLFALLFLGYFRACLQEVTVKKDFFGNLVLD